MISYPDTPDEPATEDPYTPDEPATEDPLSERPQGPSDTTFKLDLSLLWHLLKVVLVLALVSLPLIILHLYRLKQPYRQKILRIYKLLERYDHVDQEVLSIMEKRRFSEHEITKDDYLVLLKCLMELERVRLNSLNLLQKIGLYLRYGYFPKT